MHANGMMRIAITGGIGSGKSFFCRMLQRYGIEVYDCDAAAKRLMRYSRDLRDSLVGLVGDDLYEGGVLQKHLLASFILSGVENATAVNDIVHPAVAADFMGSGFAWLESAIYFSSGFYKRVSIDRVVCVTAPLEVRVARIMHRDGISREKSLEWINCQWSQAEMLRMSDYEIVNDGIADVDKQTRLLLEKLKINE